MVCKEITKTVYKIQNIAANKIPSFKTFRSVFYNLHFFYRKTLQYNYKKFKAITKKIYEFLKAIEKHPQKVALLYALTSMFEMLITTELFGSCKHVYHEKLDKYYFLDYGMIFSKFRKRKLLLRNNFVVIPYKKRWNSKKKVTIEMVEIALKEVFKIYGRDTRPEDLVRYILRNFL